MLVPSILSCDGTYRSRLCQRERFCVSVNLRCSVQRICTIKRIFYLGLFFQMGNGHHCRFQKLFFSRDNGHIKYGDSYINGKNLHHRRTVVRLVVPCHHVILLSRLQIEIGSIRQIQSDRIPIHIGIEVLPFFIPFQVFNRYQIARIVIHLVKGSTGHWYRFFRFFPRDRQHILIGLTRDIRGAIYAISTSNVQLHITLHILPLLQLKAGVQYVKSLSIFWRT